jgi:hypothetical protein
LRTVLRRMFGPEEDEVPEGRRKLYNKKPIVRSLKSKAVPLHAMEALGVPALDGGEWSESHPGRALPPRKGPPVPIGQETVWAPEPVWTQRVEENSFASAED